MFCFWNTGKKTQCIPAKIFHAISEMNFFYRLLFLICVLIASISISEAAICVREKSPGNTDEMLQKQFGVALDSCQAGVLISSSEWALIVSQQPDVAWLVSNRSGLTTLLNSQTDINWLIANRTALTTLLSGSSSSTTNASRSLDDVDPVVVAEFFGYGFASIVWIYLFSYGLGQIISLFRHLK